MQDNYTRISNSFIDLLPEMTPYQAVIMLVIYRKTVGWGKENTVISIDELSALTGIRNRNTIIKALDKLESLNLIKKSAKSGVKTLISLKKQLPTVTKSENEPVTHGYCNQLPTVTAPSIYKKKKEKEREGGLTIPDELKEIYINQKLQEMKDKGEHIRSESGLKRTIRKNLNERDATEIEEYKKWERAYKRKKEIDTYKQKVIGKSFEVATKDGESIGGVLKDILVVEDGYVICYETSNQKECRATVTSYERLKEIFGVEKGKYE